MMSFNPKFISETCKYNFNDVMLVPTQPSRLSSRSEVNLENTYNFTYTNSMISAVPIIASNMDRIGTLKMYKCLSKYNIITCFTKHISLEELCSHDLNSDLYILSSGIKDSDILCLEEKISRLNPKMVCFDVANGYMLNFLKKIKTFKSKHPDICVIAGNVVSKEMLRPLSEIGVDIVKIGIGSGSVCTTRLKTGVGYPQLSCIMDMRQEATNLGMLLLSDGGIKTPGDAAKAFAAGADFIMVGGMFAGHKESMLDSDDKDGIEFYGNSSEKALDKHYGGTKNYRTNEGKCVKVNYKGELSDTVQDLLGGIRSCCTYMDSLDLFELQDNSNFIVVNKQLNDMF